MSDFMCADHFVFYIPKSENTNVYFWLYLFK